MRWHGAVVLAIAPSGVSALEPALDPGQALEARVDADFNGDGLLDIAYVTRD